MVSCSLKLASPVLGRQGRGMHSKAVMLQAKPDTPHKQQLAGFMRWVHQCNTAQSIMHTLVTWLSAEDASGASQTLGFLRPECANNFALSL